MTLGWAFGFGDDNKIFTNDIVASEMRTSAGIEKARKDFYESGLPKILTYRYLMIMKLRPMTQTKKLN